MKKTRLMLATMATLAVGAMLFTSCNNDPKPEPKPTPNNNGVEAKEIIISREGSSSKLENVEVMEGKTTKIMISVKPATAKINEAKIADESIATFKSNVITGVKKGTTTLTVKAGKNNIEATLKITVTEKKEVTVDDMFYIIEGKAEKLLLPKDLDEVLGTLSPDQFLEFAQKNGWEKPIANGVDYWKELLASAYLISPKKQPGSKTKNFLLSAGYYHTPSQGPRFINLQVLYFYASTFKVSENKFIYDGKNDDQEAYKKWGEPWAKFFNGVFAESGFVKALMDMGYTDLMLPIILENQKKEKSLLVTVTGKNTLYDINIIGELVKDKETGKTQYVKINDKKELVIADENDPEALYFLSFNIQISKKSKEQSANTLPLCVNNSPKLEGTLTINNQPLNQLRTVNTVAHRITK